MPYIREAIIRLRLNSATVMNCIIKSHIKLQPITGFWQKIVVKS